MNDIPKPLVLIILDGWGTSPPWGGNAISLAKIPFFDKMWQSFPHTILQAFGQYVGLPGHEMGNSEVGHLNIGAGRVVNQDVSRIKKTMADGSFFKNPVLNEAIDHAAQRNGNLHLLGLLSAGSVHSHIDHLFALLDLCKRRDFQQVFVDVISDGRDADPMSAQTFIAKLQHKFKQIGFGQISTVSGRYYAMDRDSHWERTEKVYNTMVNGEGVTAETALSAVANSYNKGTTDEFILPTVIIKNGEPVAKVKSGDSIIFFNFRADRARQISQAFMTEKIDKFQRGKRIKHLFFTGLIPYGYEQEISESLKSAFNPEKIPNTLAEVLSKNKLRQLHITETEKYAHLTYFFNGGREKPFPGEERILIPSPRVATYDLKPEMSAGEITKTLLEKLDENRYDFIVVNFANPDMVGHTGNIKAEIVGIEFLDKCLQQIITETLALGGTAVVTADHGNAEEMLSPATGQLSTEHNKNPVPFILVSNLPKLKRPIAQDGLLANIAPTILEILKIRKPKEMLGKSLLLKINA